MKIVAESVELIKELDVLKKIELCGRVCYKSEDKITEDSAKTFVSNIIKRGHESVLEHGYITINHCAPLDNYLFNDGLKYTIGNVRAWRNYFKKVYRSSLIPSFKEKYPILFDDIKTTKKNIINDLFDNNYNSNYNTRLIPITVKIICDRAIANEFVRHRVMSFSQESTRYVNYNKVEPIVIDNPFFDKTSHQYGIWKASCFNSIEAYKELINNGAKPEQARGILPLSLKTELIISGYKFQFDEMIKLRTANGVHPQAIIIAKKIQELINE